MKAGIDSVAVVIPCYNRKAVTVACIRALNIYSFGKVKIFVCDSGSIDGTQEAVCQEPNTIFIAVGNESWWSAAVNIGIAAARRQGFSKIILLNDDVNFDEKLMSGLLAEAQFHPEAIISAKQKTVNGEFLGFVYKSLSKKATAINRQSASSAVDSSNGCCLLIPSEVFDAVGYFDDHRCPQLYGDVEFQLRAKRAGYPTIACSSALISQQKNTDYFARLGRANVFTHPASPLNVRAYMTFGTTLFGNISSFLLFGYRYHYGYVKSLIRYLLFYFLR